MVAPSSPGNYGATRNRAASVSFAEIDAAARRLMATGGYPSVAAVRKELNRGSTTTIAEAMRRFWTDQAALNAGNPVALTRLPPEFADAAVDLWEQALRLSQQTARSDDNAARAHLEQLRRDTDLRAHSVELREKEWDLAARVRERSLADAREHVSVLMKELAIDRAELRARDARIAELESQLEEHRRQLATVIARAIAKNRKIAVKIPRRSIRLKPKGRVTPKKRVPSKRTPHRQVKRKTHGQRQ
jgi:hypothetical protein